MYKKKKEENYACKFSFEKEKKKTEKKDKVQKVFFFHAKLLNNTSSFILF